MAAKGKVVRQTRLEGTVGPGAAIWVTSPEEADSGSPELDGIHLLAVRQRLTATLCPQHLCSRPVREK